MKKDRHGMTIDKHEVYKAFLEKLQKLGFDIEGTIPYTRHTTFAGEKCDICGGDKLISGVGRYIIFDPDGDPTEIFICGYCDSHLQEDWEIRLDYM